MKKTPNKRLLSKGAPSDQAILDHLEQAWKRELNMRHHVLSGPKREIGVAEAEDALRGIEILRQRHIRNATQESML